MADESEGRGRPQRTTPRDDQPKQGPRIIDERTVVGSEGEVGRQVVDERGRRFWDFRPARPEPYDLLGISAVWWLVFWAAVIAFAVWVWPA